MNLLAGFFRETLHYRHVWVCLAIALAHELGPTATHPIDVLAKPKLRRASLGTRYTQV
jgi:hypothetical protein